jgi:hypothetical protein
LSPRNGSRAAASSIASGIPSSCRHTSITFATFVSASVKRRSAALAASVKSAIAPKVSASASAVPLSGTASALSRKTRSPSIFSAVWLVTSRRMPRAVASSAAASSATASTRCSALSSTTSERTGTSVNAVLKLI